MKQIHQDLIRFALDSGKQLRPLAGAIEDLVDVKTQWITEQDLKIDRELREIVSRHDPNHYFYSEESETSQFSSTGHGWVADPISGTLFFIEGIPGGYSICIAEVIEGRPAFALVYDPSNDELFTAYRGGGAFLNGERIDMVKTLENGSVPITNTSNARLLVVVAGTVYGNKERSLILRSLSDFNIYRAPRSAALNYAHVAAGRYAGIVTFNKDAFTEFAGSLLIEEAGGVFLSGTQQRPIEPAVDRQFLSGHPAFVQKLEPTFASLLSQVKPGFEPTRVMPT